MLSSSNPLNTQRDVQSAILALDKSRPLSKATSVESALASQVAEPRLYTLLLVVFAAVATLLAAVGIYGVMSHSVTQRTHEIGIRIALGARNIDVLRLVVGHAMKLAAAGAAIGVTAAIALTRVMESLLFGVSATDPATFAIVSGFLISVALLASYVPARRAANVDP